MFAREIKFNQFLLGYFDQVVADVPAEQLIERGPSQGHPPVWVLGHLAIVAEMGQTLLGGQLQHFDWVSPFGPRSTDDVPNAESFAKDDLVQAIHVGYPKLGELLSTTPEDVLQGAHGVEVLDGTLIESVADLEVHLLTTHFAFHLAQLSVWRRTAGHRPLL